VAEPRRYRIEFELSAAKAIAKLDRIPRERVLTAIEALALDPRPVGAIKLTDGSGMRIRVGDYRVVYVIDDAVVTVTVVRIGHRRSIYRR